MKKSLLAFLLVASLQLVHADNVLKNSDFADGAQYWHGEGRTPEDLKPQNSLDTPVDYGDKGLIMVLRPQTWIKIVQEFKTRSASATLNVTYKIAPNTTFSSKDEVYQNVPHSIGFDVWYPFNGKRNTFMTMVCDVLNYRTTCDNVAPNFRTTDKQTYTEAIDSMVLDDEQTIYLAFPPGTGAVILLHVSLDTN